MSPLQYFGTDFTYQLPWTAALTLSFHIGHIPKTKCQTCSHKASLSRLKDWRSKGFQSESCRDHQFLRHSCRPVWPSLSCWWRHWLISDRGGLSWVCGARAALHRFDRKLTKFITPWNSTTFSSLQRSIRTHPHCPHIPSRCKDCPLRKRHLYIGIVSKKRLSKKIIAILGEISRQINIINGLVNNNFKITLKFDNPLSWILSLLQ